MIQIIASSRLSIPSTSETSNGNASRVQISKRLWPSIRTPFQTAKGSRARPAETMLDE